MAFKNATKSQPKGILIKVSLITPTSISNVIEKTSPIATIIERNVSLR